ncbi:hypothetical protein QU481_02375 [Crenobacter sp. SG2303]|uniref:Uncharacterized protein n=1 Tax=Crenobacter oryzisoli TaxID=3056844 RepID=A0ABT7XIX3_9NEIS|nr:MULTISPECIES: hypothetical protein [unclassified Crenobacter]MDN0073740.1 hypothetical protein [Crenobacter sp. SG2303]MDN0082724.1 hypothetical protein [Crenobacter sp. SG2305]
MMVLAVAFQRVAARDDLAAQLWAVRRLPTDAEKGWPRAGSVEQIEHLWIGSVVYRQRHGGFPQY